jgi:outer membrane receptor protein involved in Fe transport
MQLKICVLVLLLFTAGLSAANEFNAPKGHLKGTIVDSKSSEPVQYANVMLKQVKDSSFVAGTVTGNNGEFILPNIPEGKYYLVVTYIGYKKKTVENITLSQNELEKTIGAVKLEQQNIEMKETQVTGQKMMEEFKLDKKVINVSQDINSSGGTALDVLQNQPSVRVDADGNISLRGSTSFTVLINGRPGILQGNDALRQIAANTIDKIEIITNPSAKYDAEGASGIINIELKRSSAYDLSGVANASLGSKDKYSGDFTINNNMGEFRLNGNLNSRRNISYNYQTVNVISNLQTGPYYGGADMIQRNARNQYDGRIGFEYDLTDVSTVSLSANIGRVEFNRDYNWLLNKFQFNTDSYSEILNKVDLYANYYNAVFYYNLKITPKIDELNFEALYTKVNNPTDQYTDEYPTDSNFQNRSLTPSMASFSNGVTRNEGRMKLDYSHTYGEKSKLESGLQANLNLRTIDNLNKNYSWNLLTWIEDPVYTNNYDFRNNIYAGYIKYNNSISDVDFQFGLRGEYNDRILTQKTLGKDFKYQKFDLFPSASVSAKIFTDHQIQLSYSRRINRPNDGLLNPYPYWNTSVASIYGNPDLRPEFTDSYELNYQKMIDKTFLSVQTYYRLRTDGILEAVDVDQYGKYISIMSNFEQSKTLGAEISSSITPVVFLRFDPAINIFNYSASGVINNNNVESNQFSWTARLSAMMFFSQDSRIQVLGYYASKQIDPQSAIKALFFLNVTFRQDLFDKKLSLTLQARNLLKTSAYDALTTGNNFTSAMYQRSEVPVISLNISYNFNNFKRPAKQAENVDVNYGPQ